MNGGRCAAIPESRRSMKVINISVGVGRQVNVYDTGFVEATMALL